MNKKRLNIFFPIEMFIGGINSKQVKRELKIGECLYIKKDTHMQDRRQFGHWCTIHVWKKVNNEYNSTPQENNQA